MRALVLGLVVLLLVTLGGCATPDVVRGRLHYGMEDAPEGARLMWPTAPEVPRFLYTGTLTGEPNFRRDDVALGALATLGRWIAGLDGKSASPTVLQRPGVVVGDDADGTLAPVAQAIPNFLNTPTQRHRLQNFRLDQSICQV